jgi:zinc protease
MSEFILAKQTLLMEFEKEVQEKDKTHSRKIASEYIDHFLGESEIMDVEYRFELAQELFDEISIDDVMDLFDVYVTEENRSIMITIPETEGLILPEKDDILAIMIEMEETEHDPYNEMEVPDELLTKKPKKVSVKKPVLDKALDVHIWTLANGAKVYLKTTDFKNDEIVFRVIRRGGDSHADDNIIHSVNVATMVAEEGGLGSIDKMTLNAFLMPKDIRFNRTIDENSELLSGSSSVKDFETLMQMIYLNATDVRYDEQAFLIWKNNLKSMIKNQINNPEYNLQVQWQKLLYNDNIRKNPDLNEYIDNVDYKTAYDYYVSRFNSANDFHFMFVGNIKPNELQPFIEQYIATIPNKKTSSKVIDRGVRYNQSLQTKEIFKGLEPKSMTFISFTNDYTVKDRLVEIAQSAVASLVFNEMLRESVRETMSGVYVIQAFNDVDIIPYSQLVTHIVFGSDPDKVDEIIHEIDNQIEILKAGTFDEKYFVSAIETMRKNLDNSIKTNNYLMGRLIHNYVNKYKLHDNYKLYDNITIKDVADFATKNIDMNKRLTVILLPESYENIELEEAVGF